MKTSPDQQLLPETEHQAKRVGRCVYCGAPAEEIDHIIPRALQGPNDRGNKMPICRKCNRAKLDQPPIQFIKRLLKENGLPFKYRDVTPDQIESTMPRLLITEYTQAGFAKDGFRLALYLENERIVFEITHKSRPAKPVLQGDLLFTMVIGSDLEQWRQDAPNMTKSLAHFMAPYIPKLYVLKTLYDSAPFLVFSPHNSYNTRRIQRILTWAVDRVNWHELHTMLKNLPA